MPLDFTLDNFTDKFSLWNVLKQNNIVVVAFFGGGCLPFSPAEKLTIYIYIFVLGEGNLSLYCTEDECCGDIVASPFSFSDDIMIFGAIIKMKGKAL